MIIGIDPDPKGLAWVAYEPPTIVAGFGQGTVEDVLDPIQGQIHHAGIESFIPAIEMVACYGMAVGHEVFETAVMVGRIYQRLLPLSPRLIYRKDVKMALCHNMRAKDTNIRAAIIDIFGGSAETKKGGKLHGIHGDLWAALGVALTADLAIRQEST
ncbi:hypothetical protein MUP01_02255 [Candidatus Bathyarchaeota archaeon]|nr:hypothetical protein [Candidatus Bathyarchaeota archaeon]